MQRNFYLRLSSSLVLSAGLLLGLTPLLSEIETKVNLNGANLNGVALNGVVLNGLGLNGLRINGTHLETSSHPSLQLQLEGSQLVLHVNR
ncbi:hypothetical protein HJG54_04000 [Leptolyngbya sp. NK1-12]|uniref:Uncharacterized protein n=1 Tax=Leptolyngbya sp. NK1-12 TaxID=2547451 RepID=A0AA97APS0_9CYAN|nr:hypothetical protein [Leptolyngbya sp. NK1-12]WNZ22113.1 hypothetical protein HJG54_04000 [Leptolyngbya sp. NK1-12]